MIIYREKPIPRSTDYPNILLSGYGNGINVDPLYTLTMGNK
jgi:hypothetical protein